MSKNFKDCQAEKIKQIKNQTENQKKKADIKQQSKSNRSVVWDLLPNC